MYYSEKYEEGGGGEESGFMALLVRVQIFLFK
jgi:hypothetical protein